MNAATLTLVELTDSPELRFEPGMQLRVPPALTRSGFEKVMALAYRSNVSDVHLQSGEPIWFDLYGRKHRASNRVLNDDEVRSLLAQITSNASLGILSGGNAVNRAVTITPENLRNVNYRFRLNTVKARIGKVLDGLQVTMRSIPDAPVKIDTLNLPSEILDNFFPENGLVLVVGVTGSGKTTLLFSALRHIAETMPDKKIMTHEDPVEFTFEKVQCSGMIPSQIEIGSDLPSYRDAVQEAMRRAGQVILLGECRKKDEFGELVNAALSGHLTFSTLHAETVDQTINRILNMFPFDEQPSLASKIMGSLKMVVAQKLVKSTDGKRRPAREWLVLDKKTREELSDIPFTDWTKTIRRMVYKRKTSMLHSLFALVSAGEISPEIFFNSAGITVASASDFLMGVEDGALA